MSRLLMVDIETAPIAGVETFLGAIQAPANYRDPEKIAKYIEEAAVKERDKAALDPDLCRIVALAFQVEGETEVKGGVAKDEAEETRLLTRFWDVVRKTNGIGGVSLCGFNIAGFDVPVLARRSLYLKVAGVKFRFGRYAYQRPQIIDLMDPLTMDRHEAFKMRSKDWWVKRMGLAGAQDDNTGKNVPTLVALGLWDEILHHCKADVVKEVQMAQWLGIWPTN